MENLSAIRLRLAEIVSKADGDPEFHKKLKANPAAVLKEYGIPDNAVEMISQANGERRRAAAAIADGDPTGCIHTNGCQDFTCWSSSCPNSCYVSVVIDAPDA